MPFREKGQGLPDDSVLTRLQRDVLQAFKTGPHRLTEIVALTGHAYHMVTHAIHELVPVGHLEGPMLDVDGCPRYRLTPAGERALEE